MSEPVSTQRTGLDRALDALVSPGRAIFSLAIIAIGIETWMYARAVTQPLGPQYNALPVIPWLPSIPWLAYLFGAIWVACAVGLLSKHTAPIAAAVLGTLLFLCALLITLPKYVANPANMGLRTAVFEPLSIACLAWLLPGTGKMPSFLIRGSRYVLALSLTVFGVDHFLALVGIGSLLPNWIPWHVFWVAFFGVVFIASGLSIALNLLLRWGAAGLGLMFGIWVVTLHLPRVLGLYGIPGAPHNPDEWSSLFIAVALWGGPWALARVYSPPPRG